MTTANHAPDDNRYDFEQEFLTAVNRFADRAPAPAIDSTRIRRKARRRAAVRASGAALAVLLVTSGSALAWAAADNRPHATAAPAAGSPSAAPKPTPATGFGTASAVPQPTGNHTVIMPSVTGLTRKDAENVLTQLGLRVEVHLHTDYHVPAGRVVDAAPRAGASTQAGETVTLFVSKGKPGT